VIKLDEKIKKMYIQDNSTILVFVIIFLMFLVFVLSKVYIIAPDNATKTVIIISGTIISAFAIASSFAVLVHIKRNKIKLYSAEINSEGSH
jgi:hypothetical protein